MTEKEFITNNETRLEILKKCETNNIIFTCNFCDHTCEFKDMGDTILWRAEFLKGEKITFFYLYCPGCSLLNTGYLETPRLHKIKMISTTKKISIPEHEILERIYPPPSPPSTPKKKREKSEKEEHPVSPTTEKLTKKQKKN